MSGTAGVSGSAIAVIRGKIEQTKVKRYWIGKAQEWADSGEDDEDVRTGSKPSREVIAVGDDDPRLRRLTASKMDNLEETRASHRQIRRDEEEENRRQMEGNLALEEDDDNDDALEAEERAHEEFKKRRMEELKDESKQLVIEEIKKYEEIEKNVFEVEASIADVDTDDEVNSEDEYDAWKVREFARIKRDRKEQEAMLKEMAKEEVEIVKNTMSEEVEIVKNTMSEEVEIVKNVIEKEQREGGGKGNLKPRKSSKRKWRFMQKYYHKGAFFQSDGDDIAATAGCDNIYTWDFSAPTGEDKMNKAILPKVMQVKHFGRSGRTKWTHLVNEDTTDMKNRWTCNDLLRAKYEAKIGSYECTNIKT